jgi:hypothetical protein
MLNVQDECDLPEDDGYDLFTRETERRDWDELGRRARRRTGAYREPASLALPLTAQSSWRYRGPSA